MACRTLLRRRAQLALLGSACKRSSPARVGLRRKAGTWGQAELVGLEADGVLIAWTGKRIPEAEISGQPLEVRFAHEGEDYVFFSVAQEYARQRSQPNQARPPLRLSLPLRVERARPRQQLRLAADDLPPIVGTFTHVVDGRRQFQARVTDISEGGVGITAKTADVPSLHTGDLFWVEMELPGERERSEFVVRLVHLRPIKNTDRIAMGWVLQPTDDSANYEKHVRRLESFLTRKRPSGNGTSARSPRRSPDATHD